jgi:hypothetical protein
MLWRSSIKDYQLAFSTLVIVGALVFLRDLLFKSGFEGISSTPLTASIIGAGVFIMSLAFVGTLADYREAERAPAELAASLYAMLREAEAIHDIWGKPDVSNLRKRLCNIVSALRSDLDSGSTRDCQQAVEDLSDSIMEMENTKVPANYIVRLRQEQASLRKSVLKVYSVQREEFLPSAYAMIVSFVTAIILLLFATKLEGRLETLLTFGFISFIFIYLLRLLNIINKPFKIGQKRTDDDVSLFLLYEFVAHAKLGERQIEDTELIVKAAEAAEAAEAEKGLNHTL